MSIRLAFSTTACPDWTLSQVINQAKAMGYHGVDFATRFGRQTPESSCDPQQGDAAKIKDQLAMAGIEPICLSTNISFASADQNDGRAAIAMTRQAADRAAAIGAPAIRVLAYEAPQNEQPHNSMARVAKRVAEVVDYAGEQGVQLLFENIGSFKTARNWWWCLDSIRHPMVGLVWNPAAAATQGERPAVSVPMLNSRIRMVRLTDIHVGPPVEPVQLGDGELNIPKLLARLMGVGFEGHVVVEWDRTRRPTLAPAAEFLPEAHKRLTDWLTAINEAGQPKKVVKKAAPARAATGAAAGDAATDATAEPKPARPVLDEQAKAKLKAEALAKAAVIKAAKAAAATKATGESDASVKPTDANVDPTASDSTKAD